jgi:hypothetical protein
MKKLNKNSADEDALNCLVVGTEDQHIYIIEAEAFTILATVSGSIFELILNLVLYDDRWIVRQHHHFLMCPVFMMWNFEY